MTILFLCWYNKVSIVRRTFDIDITQCTCLVHIVCKLSQVKVEQVDPRQCEQYHQDCKRKEQTFLMHHDVTN